MVIVQRLGMCIELVKMATEFVVVVAEALEGCAQLERIVLSDYQKADLNVQSEPRCRVNKLIRKWEPPDEGMYKANCDIVVDRIVGKIGLGTVIRNSKGEVMASCAQSMTANLSLKSAKLVAVWKSITFSRDYGLNNPCAFELDEACVVKWIEKGGHRESVHGRILDDIDSIVDDIGEVVFCHIDRGANKVARGLANFALKSNDGTFWMEDFPICRLGMCIELVKMAIEFVVVVAEAVSIVIHHNVTPQELSNHSYAAAVPFIGFLP
ncbi:hypothetical protein Q3G72_023852 [Acer saccharum]|nr:hypothetical protein Q3G72_023852 [Acer saccharum]